MAGTMWLAGAAAGVAKILPSWGGGEAGGIYALRSICGGMWMAAAVGHCGLAANYTYRRLTRPREEAQAERRPAADTQAADGLAVAAKEDGAGAAQVQESDNPKRPSGATGSACVDFFSGLEPNAFVTYVWGVGCWAGLGCALSRFLLSRRSVARHVLPSFW